MDFKWLNLGKKMKQIEQEYGKRFNLDHEYLSEHLPKQDDNLLFYGCSSI
jgi:hypothetical protein